MKTASLFAFVSGLLIAAANPLFAEEYSEINRLNALLNNPIFQSSLSFLKAPVPVVDSEAEIEAEMKPYIEKILGTEQTFKMIPIKGGKFKMGSPDTELGRHEDEGPLHEVEVMPFWMEEHETTWTAFEQFALKYLRNTRKETDSLSERELLADAFAAPTRIWETGESYANRNKPDYPAASMTMYAAQAYCKWLTIMTGRYYRLPTEAEWEYACRAGSQAAYSFGDDAKKLGDYAWSVDNSQGEVQKVKLKKPNVWGLYDMHGNAAEWVLEQYAIDTYAHRKPYAFAAPVKPAFTRVSHRDGINVLRGGSVVHESVDLRSARRLHYEEKWRETEPGFPRSIWWLTDAPFVGFRVVRPLEPPKTEEDAKLYEPDPEVWLQFRERNARE